MKNAWNKYKWIFLFLINIFPFALDVIFYSNGGMNDQYLFLPVFAALTVLNYRNCKKALPYILYQTLILVCIICAGYASTYLHYHNIINDFMTLLVGELITLLEAIISFITTVITAVVKATMNKKRTQSGT